MGIQCSADATRRTVCQHCVIVKIVTTSILLRSCVSNKLSSSARLQAGVVEAVAGEGGPHEAAVREEVLQQPADLRSQSSQSLTNFNATMQKE